MPISGSVLLRAKRGKRQPPALSHECIVGTPDLDTPPLVPVLRPAHQGGGGGGTQRLLGAAN